MGDATRKRRLGNTSKGKRPTAAEPAAVVPLREASAADQMRARLGAALSTVISTGETLPLRRPNLASMLVRRVVTKEDAELVVKVSAEAAAAAGGNVQRAGEMMLAGPHSALVLAFIDVWACESIALPGVRFVTRQQDAGPSAVWVEDLPLLDRVKIVQATLSR